VSEPNLELIATDFLSVSVEQRVYMGADKSFARPGRNQANVSVGMA